jgi:hypothetical protein
MVPDIWNFEHSCKLHLLHALEMIQEIDYSFDPPGLHARHSGVYGSRAPVESGGGSKENRRECWRRDA